MEDRQLIDLVRDGLEDWEGPSPHATSARYMRVRRWTRWRYVATMSVAGAALLVIAATLAGGTVPAQLELRIAPSGALEARPSPSPAPSPHGDQGPVTRAPATPAVIKTEPAPVKTEPGATSTQPTPSGHEPAPSPSPSPTPPTRK